MASGAPLRTPLTHSQDIGQVFQLALILDLRFVDLQPLAVDGLELPHLQLRDWDKALWQAVSDTADLRREILKRHRTGEGIWHATVEILRWDVTHHSGESTASFHERCNSKKEAEEATRRMLAENAKYFSAEFSVEASVVCKLEWYEDDEDRSESPAK
jgi:hypothetical protein